MDNISVVIPSFNSESEIPLALHTLKPQLSQGDEIIIVDGGSMDETLKIASDYGCEIYVYPEASLGCARDLGVEVACNNLILQTDTDVEFTPGFIDLLKTHYNYNPDVVAVAGGWRDGKNRLLGNLVCSALEKTLGNADCIQSYRREAYYTTEGHPDTSFGEQIGIWLRMQKVGMTIYDPNLYVYHFSERNVREPSYIIGGSILTGGLLYEAGVGGSLGYGVMGHGLGWIAGQAGVDLGINKDAPPEHFHHWHLGLMMMAAGLTLSQVVSEDVVAGICGFGTGLFAHDLLTESQV